MCVCYCYHLRKYVSLCDGIYINDEVFKYVTNKMKSYHFLTFPYNKINRMKNENLTSKRDFPHTHTVLNFYVFILSLFFFLLTQPPTKNPPGESINCMSFIYACLHFNVHTLLSCAFVVILY